MLERNKDAFLKASGYNYDKSGKYCLNASDNANTKEAEEARKNARYGTS